MGNAVSAGEDNDDLIDNLVHANNVQHRRIERALRLVDRADYYETGFKQRAYEDHAWRQGNLHLSAPCIYGAVLRHLQLGEGQSFLNIGSGTGYLSTVAGLLLGDLGTNHGIEVHADVVDYANAHVARFVMRSNALDATHAGFAVPHFVVGNGLLVDVDAMGTYDRIYVGSAVPDNHQLLDLLKVGGVAVFPHDEKLCVCKRLADQTTVDGVMDVSFASLITPQPQQPPVQLPTIQPFELKHLCRLVIRRAVRQRLLDERRAQFAGIDVVNSRGDYRSIVRSAVADGRRERRRRRRHRQQQQDKADPSQSKTETLENDDDYEGKTEENSGTADETMTDNKETQLTQPLSDDQKEAWSSPSTHSSDNGDLDGSDSDANGGGGGGGRRQPPRMRVRRTVAARVLLPYFRRVTQQQRQRNQPASSSSSDDDDEMPDGDDDAAERPEQPDAVRILLSRRAAQLMQLRQRMRHNRQPRPAVGRLLVRLEKKFNDAEQQEENAPAAALDRDEEKQEGMLAAEPAPEEMAEENTAPASATTVGTIEPEAEQERQEPSASVAKSSETSEHADCECAEAAASSSSAAAHQARADSSSDSQHDVARPQQSLRTRRAQKRIMAFSSDDDSSDVHGEPNNDAGGLSDTPVSSSVVCPECGNTSCETGDHHDQDDEPHKPTKTELRIRRGLDGARVTAFSTLLRARLAQLTTLPEHLRLFVNYGRPLQGDLKNRISDVDSDPEDFK